MFQPRIRDFTKARAGAYRLGEVGLVHQEAKLPLGFGLVSAQSVELAVDGRRELFVAGRPVELGLPASHGSPGLGEFLSHFLSLVLYHEHQEMEGFPVKTSDFRDPIPGLVDHAHEANADDADAYHCHKSLDG